MIDLTLLSKLAVSLGLGLLVGMQREYADKPMAGIRTFSLVALFGSLMALLSISLKSGWVVAMGALALAIIFTGANFITNKDEPTDTGQTTEVAVLLMYSIGAYLIMGNLRLGVVIGAIAAVLLHYKTLLEKFVTDMPEKAIKAVMQFVAISLIILPVLPNKRFGPYNVLNPRDIWLMVVLIVGLSLIGYFIYKWFGDRVGTIVSGILGGLISSTATTVTYAKRSKELPEMGSLAAFIVAVASTVALLRVMLEVAVISPQHLSAIAPPLAVELGFLVLLCSGLYWRIQTQEDKEGMPEPENPAQLKTALLFAFLYGLILVLVAAAKDDLGHSGLYIVAIVSGLTDVDAITLSLSKTLNRGDITPSTAWRLILLASLSNLAFKGGMAVVLGARQLAKIIFALFGVAIVWGLLLIWLWPFG